ncbi:Protein OXIDATIVE STRESS 3 LIKE 1 [Euphorbia peplus]|nr:Protein OXIDATIVE STRESS 3 LIKE 1 [Euphorbia peplus]
MSIALNYSSRVAEIQPYTPAGLAFSNSEEDLNECSTSSSSSIGKNSDLCSSDGEEDDDEEQVQSNYKRTLDSMDSLEEALPIRRGISMYYDGKSKSFTSLAEASSSTSVKEIAKTENAYSRKRRNLNAFRSNYGGISKRAITSSKSTLAFAVAMTSCDSFTSSTSDDSSSSSTSKSSPSSLLPPLHPRSHYNLASLDCSNSSPWRSFSVADLQHCVSTASHKIHH